MQELFVESIKSVNIPYTTMFGATMAYWIMYIVGIVDADVLDFDVDVDLDADVDVDADVDGDVESNGGIFTSLLKFMYVGDVPLTVITSMMTLGMWAFSVLINFYLANTSIVIALLLMIPILLFGMLFTKLGLMPFVPILRVVFDRSGDSVEIVGKQCTVISLEANSDYGLVEIAAKGSPINVNVKTLDDEVLKKGDKAVVFDRDADGETYMITRLSLGTSDDLDKSIQDLKS
jgi:hypothetical protein